MSTLTLKEKRLLERLFEMGSGYVLNFSNRQFSDFFVDAVDRDIYADEYAGASGSKANRLRKFWSDEPDDVVARVVAALVDVAQEIGRATPEDISAARGIADRLGNGSVPSSSPAAAPAPQPPGLPRYRVLKELGSGFTGKTFLFEDNQLRRRIAIKFPTPGAMPVDFASQVRALAKVEHANVVRVYDHLTLPHPDTALSSECMAMEYVDGPLLEALITSGAISVRDAEALCDGLIAGMRAIHEAQLVHGDIHPRNVLVGGSRTPKIFDLLYRGTLRSAPTWSRTDQVNVDLQELGAMLGRIVAVAATDHAAADAFRDRVRRPIPLNELMPLVREALKERAVEAPAQAASAAAQVSPPISGGAGSGPLVDESSVAIGDLTIEASRLLRLAVKDQHGLIVISRTFDGVKVQVGQSLLSTPGDARSEARWEAAVEQLDDAGLIRDLGKGTVFKVTAAGYELVERA